MIVQLFIMGLFGSFIGSIIHCLVTKLDNTPPFYLQLKKPFLVVEICQNCHKPINIWRLFSILTLLAGKKLCRHFYYIHIDPIRYELLFAAFLIIGKIKYVYWYEITIFILLTTWFFILIIYDIKFYLLPDYLTLSLFFLGLFFCCCHLTPLNFIQALTNSCITIFSLWLMDTLFYYYKKKNGLGLGDIKLMMALSTWYPLMDILHIIILASSLALLWIIIIWFVKRKTLLKIPFGPFILFSAWIILLYN